MTAPARLAALQDKGECALVDALKGEICDIVRHEAAFLLGQLQQKGYVIGKELVLDALVKSAAEDKSILVRHEAVLSLAHFRCSQALRAIVFALRDGAPEVYSSAYYALEQMALTK